MRIEGRIEAGSLLLRLRNGQKRLDYAVSQALNETALHVQQDLFANARAKFHVRVPGLFFGYGGKVGGVAAKITRFANARRGVMHAEIIAGHDAAARMGARHLLFGTFERGGTRTPQYGSKRVSIPITGVARATMAEKVMPSMTWKGMGLTAYKGKTRLRRVGGPGGYHWDRRWKSKSPERGYGAEGSPVPTFDAAGVQWKGKRRIFMLLKTRAYPLGAVFQRFGPGRGDIRMVWKFQAGVQIDTRLQMLPTAEASWRGYYRRAFDAAVLRTLTYHKFAFVR